MLGTRAWSCFTCGGPDDHAMPGNIGCNITKR